MSQSFTDLAWEQLAKYEEMATHARKCAATAESREERDYFVEIALEWERLAAKLKAMASEPAPAESGAGLRATPSQPATPLL